MLAVCTASSSAYGLLPAFIGGMLEALPPNMRMIDAVFVVCLSWSSALQVAGS
jgi:hypothetical protein